MILCKKKKKLPKTLELFVSGSFHFIFSAYSWMKTGRTTHNWVVMLENSVLCAWHAVAEAALKSEHL